MFIIETIIKMLIGWLVCPMMIVVYATDPWLPALTLLFTGHCDVAGMLVTSALYYIYSLTHCLSVQDIISKSSFASMVYFVDHLFGCYFNKFLPSVTNSD